MTKTIAGLSSLAACALLAGAPQPATELSGQVAAGAYALDNPVVIAAAEDGSTYVTHVRADRGFRLIVPSGSRYDLTLANSTRAGTYAIVSHINWRTAKEPTRYLRPDGGAVDLGTVSPIDWNAAAASDGLATLSQPMDKPHGHAGDGEDSADDDGGKQKPVEVCTDPTVEESESEHECHGKKDEDDDALGASAEALGMGTQKVTICHIPPGNPANAHTITIGAPGVPAHLAHGDHLGACLPAEQDPPPPCQSVNPDPVSPDPNGAPGGGGGSTDCGTGCMSSTSDGTTSVYKPGPTRSGTGVEGSPCAVNDDCIGGLYCVAEKCSIVVL